MTRKISGMACAATIFFVLGLSPAQADTIYDVNISCSDCGYAPFSFTGPASLTGTIAYDGSSGFFPAVNTGPFNTGGNNTFAALADDITAYSLTLTLPTLSGGESSTIVSSGASASNEFDANTIAIGTSVLSASTSSLFLISLTRARSISIPRRHICCFAVLRPTAPV
jgi:hypothetical protein